MPAAVSRRAFLIGRSASAEAPFAQVGRSCLSYAGVVCQNCRDACGPGAIAFPMLAGAVARPVVDAGRCTACGECVAVCPTQAITLAGGAK